MATLVQMARDIYPHDKVADEFYVVAVKGYDTDDKKEHGRGGHRRAGRRGAGAGPCDPICPLAGRTTASRYCTAIEKTAFFQTVRSDW